MKITNHTCGGNSWLQTPCGMVSHSKRTILLRMCEGGGDVVGVLTPLVGGVAQAFHDDRVVELRVTWKEKKKGRNESRRCAHAYDRG